MAAAAINIVGDFLARNVWLRFRARRTAAAIDALSVALAGR